MRYLVRAAPATNRRRGLERRPAGPIGSGRPEVEGTLSVENDLVDPIAAAVRYGDLDSIGWSRPHRPSLEGRLRPLPARPGPAGQNYPCLPRRRLRDDRRALMAGEVSRDQSVAPTILGRARSGSAREKRASPERLARPNAQDGPSAARAG